MSKKTNDLYQMALVEAKKKKPDNKKVFSLLMKSMRKGNPQATYALATWYLHGKHVKKNLHKAIQLLRQAVRMNVKEALFDLAVSYEKGIGVKKMKGSHLRIIYVQCYTEITNQFMK